MDEEKWLWDFMCVLLSCFFLLSLLFFSLPTSISCLYSFFLPWFPSWSWLLRTCQRHRHWAEKPLWLPLSWTLIIEGQRFYLSSLRASSLCKHSDLCRWSQQLSGWPPRVSLYSLNHTWREKSSSEMHCHHPVLSLFSSRKAYTLENTLFINT